MCRLAQRPVLLLEAAAPEEPDGPTPPCHFPYGATGLWRALLRPAICCCKHLCLLPSMQTTVCPSSPLPSNCSSSPLPRDGH